MAAEPGLSVIPAASPTPQPGAAGVGTSVREANALLRQADEAARQRDRRAEASLRRAASLAYADAAAAADPPTRRALAIIGANQLDIAERLERHQPAKPEPAPAAREPKPEPMPEPEPEPVPESKDEDEDEAEADGEDELRRRIAQLSGGMESLEAELRGLGFERGPTAAAAPSSERQRLGESFMVVSQALRAPSRSPPALAPVEEAGPGAEAEAEADPDASQKQILRLVQTISTLADENHALLAAAEERAALASENRALRERVEQFRAKYSQRFEQLKTALTEFERLYPRRATTTTTTTTTPAAAPAPAAEEPDNAHTAARAAQLERTIHQLTARLRQQQEAAREKDAIIKRYSKWFNAIKTGAVAKKRRSLASPGPGPGPAPAPAPAAPSPQVPAPGTPPRAPSGSLRAFDRARERHRDMRPSNKHPA